ncbi:hypothetical protein RclHR1_00160013 [Rhizophagus clarus]|uniref:Uncharacterized protein n=1 Tax=Rhizophagus clarus TaxID=94130 RepID=A0A2Z6QGN5_9GLOM|nr:hypothetical protein RclHR1_00160013 [Rhizophagus clarus]GES81105.1 hypothetical protein GLOIN_2v1689680 [Rhizophagus clarus]
MPSAISFTPIPLVMGQNTTVHITGKVPVIIENGALYKITGFYENKQVFHHKVGFCEAIVTPSGYTCQRFIMC